MPPTTRPTRPAPRSRRPARKSRRRRRRTKRRSTADPQLVRVVSLVRFVDIVAVVGGQRDVEVPIWLQSREVDARNALWIDNAWTMKVDVDVPFVAHTPPRSVGSEVRNT